MITIKDNRAHVVFDSLEEMKANLPTFIKQQNEDVWKASVLSAGYGTSWFGTRDAREAMEKIEKGWPDLTQKLQPMVAQLRQKMNLDSVMAVSSEVRRRKRHRGDYGDALDMTRVWSGDLDHAWERPMKFPRLAAHQRYATIYVDLAANAGVTNSEMMWGAALSLCVIDVLTRMGLNTEVWCGSSCYGPFIGSGAPREMISGVRVKEFSQPLNEDRLVVMLSAAFFRTWGFGMIMAPDFKASSGLGSAQQRGLPLPLEERLAKGERVFRISGAHSAYAAEQSMQAVMSALADRKENRDDAA